MTHELHYPEVLTYWISDYQGIIGYGKTYPTQTTTSGADTFETFTDVAVWEARLAGNGITPDQEGAA